MFVENYLADTAQHVASAYLTFVAVDAKSNHLKVAPVVPDTDEQQRRYDDAGRRRESRSDLNSIGGASCSANQLQTLRHLS